MQASQKVFSALAISLFSVLAACQGGSAGQASSALADATKTPTAVPVIVMAVAKVTPGNEEAFKEAAIKILAPTRAEAGNISYDFHQSSTDPTLFETYEQWATQANIDAHMQAPHMQAFFGVVGPLFVTGYPQINEFTKLERGD